MGRIYLPISFITLIYLSLPHYPFILTDFLHLGGDFKLLLWKLWKERVRKAALGSHKIYSF